MKSGHLIFPALFLLILFGGAFWIFRSADDIHYAASDQPVYLESTDRTSEVAVESVGITREKAHQSFTRFADSLVQLDVLSIEDRDHLEQILLLGEAHWGEENWDPAFYAFERVVNDLRPLINEELGHEKATEMEALYRTASQSITNEIALAEPTYLSAIETANLGYNSLQEKDWIATIQSFAKALDGLNLVKAQAAEAVAKKLKEAYSTLESGDTESATELFNEILAVYPESREAIKGLSLFQEEPEPLKIPESVESGIDIEFDTSADTANTPLFPAEPQTDLEESEDPVIAEADRHFEKRELKESLLLYLEAYSKNPKSEGLTERIRRTREALQTEETIRLMDKASILAELGHWTGVIKTYRQILNVDPVNNEARRGWEEALLSLVEQKKFEQYKALIWHHLNARQYAHANDILAEAKTQLREEANQDNLFLAEQLELEKLHSPVTLNLESDGETWVTIPGKLPPEQFNKREITLFPGNVDFVVLKRGFKHKSLSLKFSATEVPESVKLNCDSEIEWQNYQDLGGSDRVFNALAAFDLIDLIGDKNGVTNWVRAGKKMNAILTSEKQLQDWDQALMSKAYVLLSEKAEHSYDLIHLEARAHFLQVPDSLARQEAIELGQYIMSLE